MDIITKGTKDYKYDSDTSIKVPEILINEKSFEDILRKKHLEEFSKGRFKEIMIPVLTGNLDDKEYGKKVAKDYLPLAGESKVVPLYSCQDGCCIYVFVEIENAGTSIIWKKIGQNTLYVSDQTVNKIDWLSDFECVQFDLADYHVFLEEFK